MSKQTRNKQRIDKKDIKQMKGTQQKTPIHTDSKVQYC